MAKVTRKPGPGQKQLVAIAEFGRMRGRVGWFESARYPDGMPVAYAAAINEFGWPKGNIPPRLGMRTTAAAKQPEWRATADRAAHGIVTGRLTPTQGMDMIGLKAAGDLRKHITEVTQPPLKVATVKARLAGRKQGRVVSITIAKPLVRTGHMLTTLTNVTDRAG